MSRFLVKDDTGDIKGSNSAQNLQRSRQTSNESRKGNSPIRIESFERQKRKSQVKNNISLQQQTKVNFVVPRNMIIKSEEHLETESKTKTRVVTMNRKGYPESGAHIR